MQQLLPGGQGRKGREERRVSGRGKKVFFHPLFLLSFFYRSNDDGEEEKHAKLAG